MKHDKLITIRTSELVQAVIQTLDLHYGPVDRQLLTDDAIFRANEREVVSSLLMNLMGRIDLLNHNNFINQGDTQ